MNISLVSMKILVVAYFTKTIRLSYLSPIAQYPSILRRVVHEVIKINVSAKTWHIDDSQTREQRYDLMQALAKSVCIVVCFSSSDEQC